MTWYLDCYFYGALGGKDFPVNSYSGSLDDLLHAAKGVLESDISGIDEVRIVRETKGQSPIPIDSRKADSVS